MGVLDVDHGRSGPDVVRSFGWNFVVAALRTFAAIVLALAAVSGAGGDAGRAAFAAGAAFVAVVALRTVWSGAYPERDALVVRGHLRSWRVQWDEIEDVVRSPWWGGFYLWLALRGDGHVPVIGCSSFRASVLEEMAAEIRAARPR